MIFRGYFHFDGSPYIDVFVITPKSKRKIAFLIDTGSPVSIISEIDLRKLSYKKEDLKPFENAMLGVGGGTAEPYFIENISLAFPGRNKLYKLKIKHLLTMIYTQMDIQMKKQIPSILGRDILLKHRLILDKKHNEIFLEKK